MIKPSAPPADVPLTAPPLTGRTADDPLRRAAARVLRDNWVGTHTVPSRTLYPHQWSWDSAFAAIGLRHLSPEHAQRELESLLAAQWADGRIPHIVFDPGTPPAAYFPGPDFWQADPACAARTSGIVQPPVHALAAWLVHRADPRASARRGFLARVYPRLAAWHRYLLRHRDLGGTGLAAIVHPWESGMDNSPCWDRPLRRVDPVPADDFRRRDLEHSEAGARPTDLDYGRYVRLAADYRDHGYQDAATPHAFAVEDPCFNALLILSEQALSEMAEAVGGASGAHRARAAALTDALVSHLYDSRTELFRPRDVLARDLTGDLIPENSVAGLVPLAVPSLPAEIAEALVRTATGEAFGLGRVCMVPSYDLAGRAFESGRYWRGPSWFNMAWLVHRGLAEHGAGREAADLRASMLAAAGRTGFSEYVDPLTGEGRGSRDFTWTAATVLDLLATGTGGERSAATV